jgi:virginiamycin B lyase
MIRQNLPALKTEHGGTSLYCRLATSPLVRCCLLFLEAAILMLVSFRVTFSSATAPPISQITSLSASNPRSACVVRFLPDTQQFYTYTIPTDGSHPTGIAVVSNTTNIDVWFADTEANQIGRLVYTSTVDYYFVTYTVPTTDSQPLNVTVSDGYVWFTEQIGNAIGRLNPTTGQVTEFAVPTPSSGPADIAAAADGTLWFTEQNANKLASLVVTTTTDFDFNEYDIPTVDSRPYGLVVESNDTVWFTETKGEKLTRFRTWQEPPFASSPQSTPGSYPYELTMGPTGHLWFTEIQANKIAKFHVSTISFVNDYTVPTANSAPAGVAIDSQGRPWFTERNGNQIGQLVPSTGVINEYLIPLPSVSPEGITVDASDAVWFVCSMRTLIYLPIIVKGFTQ